jgi:hypothetical protein
VLRARIRLKNTHPIYTEVRLKQALQSAALYRRCRHRRGEVREKHQRMPAVLRRCKVASASGHGLNSQKHWSNRCLFSVERSSAKVFAAYTRDSSVICRKSTQVRLMARSHVYSNWRARHKSARSVPLPGRTSSARPAIGRGSNVVKASNATARYRATRVLARNSRPVAELTRVRRLKNIFD